MTFIITYLVISIVNYTISIMCIWAVNRFLDWKRQRQEVQLYQEQQQSFRYWEWDLAQETQEHRQYLISDEYAIMSEQSLLIYELASGEIEEWLNDNYTTGEVIMLYPNQFQVTIYESIHDVMIDLESWNFGHIRIGRRLFFGNNTDKVDWKKEGF